MGEELTLYYLGGYDILIDRNQVVELGEGDFVPPQWSSSRQRDASLELMLDCIPDGVIIIDTEIRRQPNRGGEVAANLIEQRTTRIDLPTTPRIKLFGWEQPGGGIPERCADMPNVAGGSDG